MSNFEHMIGVVSHARVTKGNRTYDPYTNCLAHYPLDCQGIHKTYTYIIQIYIYKIVYILKSQHTMFDFELPTFTSRNILFKVLAIGGYTFFQAKSCENSRWGSSLQSNAFIAS